VIYIISPHPTLSLWRGLFCLHLNCVYRLARRERKQDLYLTRARIAAFVPLSFWERAGVRVFKKAQIVAIHSIAYFMHDPTPKFHHEEHEYHI